MKSEVLIQGLCGSPQGGPVVTLPLVNSGEMDFSISISIPVAFAAQGRAMFKKSGKQSKVRVVATLSPLHLGFYGRNDSPIKTIADLKGSALATSIQNSA